MSDVGFSEIDLSFVFFLLLRLPCELNSFVKRESVILSILVLQSP